MEGTPSDTTASSEKKGEDKDKKTEKAFGLGKSTFEFAHKKDAAEKIADSSSLWERLIPKDGGEKAKKESLLETKEPSTEKTEEKAQVEDMPGDKKIELPSELSAEASTEEVADPTVENLSDGEKTTATEFFEEQQAEAATAELSSTDDPEKIAELTEVINHYDKRKQERTTLAQDVPEAAPETIVEAESPEQSGAEADPAEFEHEQVIDLSTPEQAVPVAAEADDEDEPDPTQSAQQAAAGATSLPAPAPAGPNGVNGAGGNGNQPPAGPNAQPAVPFGPGGGGVPGGGNTSFNTAPLYGYNPNANTTVNVETNNYYQENGGAYLLAGGILGYMLGRRRGRIKTERRMKAVSKKLEKQIDDIRQTVVRQETVIRQQARDNYNLTRARRGAETTAARTVEPARRAETVTRLTTAEINTNRRQAAERLGMNQAEAAVTAERVQRMDHREVLAIAEKVTVDGTSLKTIYEAKQITEPGLRRITREFLRGGNVKAALAHEVKVKEMQYERDPQMRDRLAASYAGVEAASPQASTEAMAALVAQGAQPTPYQLHQKTDQTSKTGKSGPGTSKKFLVSAWAVFVFVLVITAVILAARK